MEPEKTNDKPVFTVQDGDGKTFILFSHNSLLFNSIVYGNPV